jgi:hypothetical protein
MSRFIHKYTTEESFSNDYNGENYKEPWVSLTKPEYPGRVDYNKKLEVVTVKYMHMGERDFVLDEVVEFEGKEVDFSTFIEPVYRAADRSYRLSVDFFGLDGEKDPVALMNPENLFAGGQDCSSFGVNDISYNEEQERYYDFELGEFSDSAIGNTITVTWESAMC